MVYDADVEAYENHISLATALAIGLLVGSAGAPNLAPRPAVAADSTAPEHTISVTGTGRVTLTPDIADLRIGVNLTRPTATEARSAAAAAMTKVVAAIKKGGVADKDVQTSLLSLQPVYDYSNNGQGRLTGFQVANVVAVTVRNIDTVGDLVDAGSRRNPPRRHDENGNSEQIGDDPRAAGKQERCRKGRRPRAEGQRGSDRESHRGRNTARPGAGRATTSNPGATCESFDGSARFAITSGARSSCVRPLTRSSISSFFITEATSSRSALQYEGSLLLSERSAL